MKRCLLVVAALSAGLGGDSRIARGAQTPNVLFIAVDDLNHWVGYLGGNPQTKTPNIDRLASTGVTFTRAYCAAPVCNPSRAALMSGLRPSTTGVYENAQRLAAGDPAKTRCSPPHFRKAGYDVSGAGKIYHGAADRRGEWDDYLARQGVGAAASRRQGRRRRRHQVRPARLQRRGPARLRRSSSYGIDQLGGEARQAVLPRRRPAQAAHAVERAAEVLRHVPARHDRAPAAPRGRPRRRPARRREDGQARGRPRGRSSSRAAGRRPCRATSPRSRTATRMIGRLLDAFDKLAATATTRSSCFWGDHGWHLGEKQHWRKFALWEEATRTRFIWVAPGVTKPGGVCDRTVDFMSIYPTLCDLCGIPHAEARRGREHPRRCSTDPKAPWDTPAVTTYRFKNHAVRDRGLALHPLRQRRRGTLRRGRRPARVDQPRQARRPRRTQGRTREVAAEDRRGQPAGQRPGRQEGGIAIDGLPRPAPAMSPNDGPPDRPAMRRDAAPAKSFEARTASPNRSRPRRQRRQGE